MSLVLAALLLAQAAGAPATPEAIVQRQVDAYNARDLEAFLATYADDAEVLIDGATPIVGQAALRARYAPVFARGRVTVRISHRTVLGDVVVDEEHGRFGSREICCAVGIYRVADGKIRSVRIYASPELFQAMRQ